MLSENLNFDLYDKNDENCFNELVSIIWVVLCHISTRNIMLRRSPAIRFWNQYFYNHLHCCQPHQLLLWSNSPQNKGYWNIPCYVAVELQRGLWTNQCFPHVPTQWGDAVLPVGYQWAQRVGLLVDDNEINLLADLHTKTDLGEGCVPVGR